MGLGDGALWVWVRVRVSYQLQPGGLPAGAWGVISCSLGGYQLEPGGLPAAACWVTSWSLGGYQLQPVGLPAGAGTHKKHVKQRGHIP